MKTRAAAGCLGFGVAVVAVLVGVTIVLDAAGEILIEVFSDE